MNIEQNLQAILEHQDSIMAAIQPKMAKLFKPRKKKTLKSLADLPSENNLK